MKVRAIFFASCATMILATGIAQAGPCNTANKDAGSGPTPGHTAQTTGTANPRGEHPPTDTMNRGVEWGGHILAGRTAADAGSANRFAGSARREGKSGKRRLLA
jgi:hypothetical protein